MKLRGAFNWWSWTDLRNFKNFVSLKFSFVMLANFLNMIHNSDMNISNNALRPNIIVPCWEYIQLIPAVAG